MKQKSLHWVYLGPDHHKEIFGIWAQKAPIFKIQSAATHIYGFVCYVKHALLMVASYDNGKVLQFNVDKNHTAPKCIQQFFLLNS